MNVLILYQHIEREKYLINKLKKEFLDNEEIENVYVYSINYEWTKALIISKLKKIDIMIIPWLYHDQNYQLFYPIIDKKNCLMFNLHQEEIAPPFSEKFLLPQSKAAKDGCIHFVWSEYFKKKLINIGVESSIIYVTGNIRTDEMFELNKEKNIMLKDKLSLKYNLSTKKRWILYSENRGWVNNWNKKMEKERLQSGANVKELNEYRKIFSKALSETYKQLNNLTESFFENFELIYRPHPGTFTNEIINPQISVITDGSIYEWLSIVDANIVWSSTTIFESDMMGVPSIVHEAIPNIPLYKTEGIEKYLTLSNINNLDSEYIQKAFILQNKNKVYKKYYDNISGSVDKYIVDKIIKIKNSNIKFNYPKINLNIKRYIRILLFEITTYFFYQLGLIKFIKWPKSAYSDYTDIPYAKENRGKIK